MIKIWKVSGFVAGALSLMAAAPGADTLKGRVVGAGSAPLAGVKVAIARLGLLDTTGADGVFELKVPGSGILRKNEIAFSGISMGATGKDAELSGARDMLGKSVPGSAAFNRILILQGRARESRDILSASAPGNSAALRKSSGLLKSAADGDSLIFNKAGWFSKKVAMPAAAVDMGDVPLDRDLVGVGAANDDKFDRQIVDAYINNGLDSTLAMVVKAMIPIESSFNPQAISMYDTQLPCGTHSYGLIQVTPGCERGYATLPAGTKVTATISGGLNTQPAVLTWLDPADKASGNTIIQEAGIIINLVTNPANPLWPTSAFNPAYAIDHGAKALKGVLSEMKGSFSGCTAGNYVAMALAGYNQGSNNIKSCTTYGANGQLYADNVLKKYRDYCKSAGVTPIY